MDAMANEWDLVKEWAFGTVKERGLLILPSLNNCFIKNTSLNPHLLKMSSMLHKGFTEKPDDEEGIKLLNGRT